MNSSSPKTAKSLSAAKMFPAATGNKVLSAPRTTTPACFPPTPTGKPRFSVIAARAAQILEGRQDDVAECVGADFSTPSSSRSALDQLLDRFSGTRSGGSRADSQLEQELNLSSLDRVELLSALEERFHVELNETAFANAKTVADVERVLQQPAARRTRSTSRIDVFGTA